MHNVTGITVFFFFSLEYMIRLLRACTGRGSAILRFILCCVKKKREIVVAVMCGEKII